MFQNKRELDCLLEDYKDIDWDNLTPLEEIDDIWLVEARKTNGVMMSLDEEYLSRERAEQAAEKVKKWINIDSTTIRVFPEKPSSQVWLHILKHIKDGVENGTIEFPIYIGP